MKAFGTLKRWAAALPTGIGASITAALLISAVEPPQLSAQQGRAAVTATAQYDTLLFNGLRYRMIGPFRGGRSTAVSGHPSHPFEYVMGSTGGGVWRTRDAGTNWQNISDGHFGGSIGAVAIAPSDFNVIYVGTGSACIRGNTSPGHGAYRSTDGGRSWSFIGLPEAGQIGRIVVHPDDPDHAYVAALGHAFGKNRERGVFRTRDGGKTWENVLFLSDSTGAVDIAMNPRNPRILYAGMWRAERKPWTLISGADEGGVYRSRDGGETWHKLSGGLPTGMTGKIGVTVSAANPDRVWAIVEAEPDGGVYRSDDGGETWRRTNSDNNLRQRAWYYTHVTADPQDENTVYVLNVQMWRSVDGGKTFEVVNVPHGDVHDLWINPHDSKLMTVADDGGGAVSVNGGRSWSSYYNQPTAELYGVAVDNQFPYRVYGAQQDNTGISIPVWMSSHTLYDKQHWQYPAACETGPIAFHPDRPHIVWGGCYGGAINVMDMRTDQRRNVIAYPQLQLGQAAKDLRHRFQWVSPIVVSPHDPETVYHASQYVLRTRDRGMTWDVISPDLTLNDPRYQEAAGGPINNDVTGVEIFGTIFSLAVSPHDANTLWAGSDDGRVHVTRDGGATWQDVTPRDMPALGTVNRIELSRHSPGRAYLAVQRYRMDDFAPYIFRTEDGGRTWRRITAGIDAKHPVRVVREDPDRAGLLFAGTEFGLYVSFDDGARWQRLQLNLPITPVTDLAVHQKDLVVATQGRSFWVLDDITPLHQLQQDVARATSHLYRPRDAYRADKGGIRDEYSPQPAPNGATIYYYLAASASDSVRIRIVDAAGRTVRTFTSDSAGSAAARQPRLSTKAGTTRFTWDLTYQGPRTLDGAVVWGYTGGVKAPPGTYTVVMETAGGQNTQTFRLLPDPRIPEVTQAEYEEQWRTAVAIRDSITAVYDAIGTIRSVREQAHAVVDRARDMERTGTLPQLATDLDAKLTAIEDELIQRRSRSGQDPIRFPGRLDNQLSELYGNVTGTDGYIGGGPEGRPTRGALERMRDLNVQWNELRTRLDAVLTNDLAAFNAAVQAAGIPPVVTKRAPRPIT
jgi:photosystem II stability/assembly factor-like uncharacterized protein